MKHWYAVYCRPQQDARAELHLQRQGYDVYRPLGRVRRRRGSRMVTLVDSLFPRYVFIRLDAVDENWAPIRSTRGAAGLVRLGGVAATVPAAVIEALRERTDPETGVVDLAAGDDYRLGEAVRITEGPFAEHEALFQARTSRERVVVLLEIMHQAQKITLPEAAISRS